MFKKRKTVGGVVLWVVIVLALLAFVSVFSVFGNGRGDGDTIRLPTVTVTAPSTTVKPATPPVSEQLPSTEGPSATTVSPSVTTSPVTTAPPEPEPVPGEVPVSRMRGWYQDALGNYISYQTSDGFFIRYGHTGGAFVPIEVPESGIYSIAFEVADCDSSSENFLAYIRNGYGDPYSGFVTENFYKVDTVLQLDIALNEGENEVFVWFDELSCLITSITYEKVADYDLAITDFTAEGVGAIELYSGNASLKFNDEGDVSNSVIKSASFTVAEDGTYDLSFIAGSKCCPIVRVLDSTGSVAARFVYQSTWNEYGVNPVYNNQSTIYIPPKTVGLAAGEYTIEIAFGDSYEYQDAILVHSAYLTKK